MKFHVKITLIKLKDPVINDDLFTESQAKDLFHTVALFSCKVKLSSNLKFPMFDLLRQMIDGFIELSVKIVFQCANLWTWFQEYFYACQDCWCNWGYFFDTFIHTSSSFLQNFSMSMLHYPIYSLIILHIHLRHQTLQLLSLHIRDLIDTIGSIIAICYWLKLNFEKLILSYVTILSTNYLMRIKVRWISQRMILCCMISMLFP